MSLKTQKTISSEETVKLGQITAYRRTISHLLLAAFSPFPVMPVPFHFSHQEHSVTIHNGTERFLALDREIDTNHIYSVT